MEIRSLDRADIGEWVDLRAALWPDQSRAELESEGRAAIAAASPLVVFVADDDGLLAGFIEISLRSHAEGCDGSPVPYVEGWYVRDDARRRGIGGALLRAVGSAATPAGLVVPARCGTPASLSSPRSESNRRPDAYKAPALTS